MFRKFFKRKEKANEYDVRYQLPEPIIDFNHAMDTVNRWLDSEEDTNNKIILLDFILEVVKDDIKTDLLSTILYSEEHFKDSLPYYLFPSTYFDEHGNEIKTYSENSMKRKIDLASDCVWVMPWRRDSLRSMILDVFKNGFKFDKGNHRAYYYTYLDICHVCGGNHSIAAGVVHKKGFIEAEVCDVGRLFDHVYTDGVKWYNAHVGTKLGDLADFRIGIMYEVAKIKHNLNTLTD